MGNVNQDFSNPFKNLKCDSYLLIAAGAGPKNVEFPDGTIVNASDVKKRLGYPQLFAWNAEQKELLSWVAYLKEHPECPCKLVVDSGAYSAWSVGKSFDLDEYIDFLNSNDVIEQAFWCAEADVIPGSFGVDPTEEERLNAPKHSWENYLYMLKYVKIPKKIVPIFHQGEDFFYLNQMLEYTFDDGDHIPYIGISPRNDVNVKEKQRWYEDVWKYIKESSNPNVLTHNFGMTSLSIMNTYPSCSSDSTSWLKHASFGKIIIASKNTFKTILVSDRKIYDDEHIYNQPEEIKQVVQKICDYIGHGLTVKDLVENDPVGKFRTIFNLYSLNNWRIAFKGAKETTFTKTSLW